MHRAAVDAEAAGRLRNVPARLIQNPLQHRAGFALRRALEKHEWNQSQAARYLDISRKTLIYRMEKHGLGQPVEVGKS